MTSRGLLLLWNFLLLAGMPTPSVFPVCCLVARQVAEMRARRWVSMRDCRLLCVRGSWIRLFDNVLLLIPARLLWIVAAGWIPLLPA